MIDTPPALAVGSVNRLINNKRIKAFCLTKPKNRI